MLARQTYRFQYERLHRKRAEKGTLLRVWISWLVSLGMVCLVFAILGLLLRAIGLPVETNQAYIAYGSIALAVALFPIVAVMLYAPMIERAKMKRCAALFLDGLRKLYPALLIICVLIVAINFGLTQLIHNNLIMTIVSIILSSILWTIAWEECLRIYITDHNPQE